MRDSVRDSVRDPVRDSVRDSVRDVVSHAVYVLFLYREEYVSRIGSNVVCVDYVFGPISSRLLIGCVS